MSTSPILMIFQIRSRRWEKIRTLSMDMCEKTEESESGMKSG